MRATLLFLLLLLVPHHAQAHGIGMQYALPLPLDYFVVGGGLVVMASFFAAALIPSLPSIGAYPTRDIAPTSPRLATALRIFGAFVFIMTIVAGFIGAPNPYKNISVVMVWVIAWVGIAYASALFGNVWAVLNPWSTIFRWAEALGVRTLGVPYPAWLGAWPAFAQLFVFAWLEINWPGSGVPFKVAIVLVAFTALTWGGMYIFGREAWANNGGVFVLVFGLFARFGLFEMRSGRIVLRPPAVGLLTTKPATFSQICFVILILATVTYDGFGETEPFQILALGLFEHLQGLGPSAVAIVSTIGLAIFSLLFTLAYLIVVTLVRAVGGRDVSPGDVAGTFVYSLIPIAIAYHFAHYLTLLLFEGQNVIALISDPFGMGWNLFGTANYRADITIVTAGFLWFFSLTVIVLGHVAAVYLAHVEALRLFRTSRAALLSQVPMLALMVGYTMISLWIIAQPLVR